MKLFKWVKNLFKKKKKRELELELAYTFKTGEKIYTYKAKDYGKISSRYYRNIQEASNYLKTFLMAKNEWETSVFGIKDLINNSLDSGKGHTRALMDINSTMDWFIGKMKNAKSADESILELIFCMFYIIEDEIEMGYSEIHNTKKIALLNQEPEMRDFFLSRLKKSTESYLPMSREDSLQCFLDLKMTEKNLMSLSSLEN